MSKAIHDVRSARLAGVVADQGWDGLVLYGNAWQCDYLRYATDYVCIEGNAIAVAMEDGETRLFVEFPLEAGRAESECPWLDVSWSTDAVTAAAAFLDGLGNRKIASAPATQMPYGLIQGRRGQAMEDAGNAMDELLLAKADIELDAIGHACGFADRGYRVFMDACRPGGGDRRI